MDGQVVTTRSAKSIPGSKQGSVSSRSMASLRLRLLRQNAKSIGIGMTGVAVLEGRYSFGVINQDLDTVLAVRGNHEAFGV